MKRCDCCGVVGEYESCENCGAPLSDRLNSLVGFRNWWWNVGSGIGPKENHDMEEHASRISEIAWDAAKSENTEFLKQLKDYMASDDVNADGCEYSLVMNRVFQKAEELFKPNS